MKTKHYQIQSQSYTSTVQWQNNDFVIVNKSHHYQGGKYVDITSTSWHLIIANIPSERIWLRSATEWIPLTGHTLLYLPKFSIIEFKVTEGPFNYLLLCSSKESINEFSGPRFVTNELSKIQSPQTLSETLRFINGMRAAIPITIERYQSKMAELMKSSLDLEFDQDVKISDIADRYNYSRDVMSRAFTKVYGISPIEYRHRLRIFDALRMMRLGFSITESSYSVGYRDPSQFNVQFKKYLGVSPQHFHPILTKVENENKSVQVNSQL